MFKLEFVVDDDFDSPVAKAFIGVFDPDGENEPNYNVFVGYWSRHRYAQQWEKALKELKKNGKAAINIFVEDRADPDSYIKFLKAWKSGNQYVFQNGIVDCCDLDESIDIDNLHNIVKDKPDLEGPYEQVGIDSVETVLGNLTSYLANCPDAHKIVYIDEES